MPEKEPHAGLRESARDRTEGEREQLGFITTLFVAIKNSRIFEPENDAAVQSITNLLTSVRATVEAEGSLALRLVHNYLVLNDRRLKADLSLLNCYGFIIDELRAKKVTRITFEEDIKKEELGRFIRLFGKFKPRSDEPFEEFSSELEAAGITGVTVASETGGRGSPIDQEIRERSIRSYFQAISIGREVLMRTQKGRAISFRRAKRLVQSMIDIATEDDYFLLALSSIKNCDEYTFNHSANVCVMSLGLGHRLGLARLALEALGLGALLHDIGKVMIPESVLNKPGELSDHEWALMQRHPSMGVRSLLKDHAPSDLLLHAILVAFEHHQRVDMSGYPEVMEKYEQNLLSKIVAIADCYDALTTSRIYKQMAMKPPQAFSVMVSESGTTFDPDLLKLFIRSIGLYPIGSLVKLDTGETGLVCSVNQQPQFIDRPLVKVIYDPSGNLTMTVIDVAETDAASGAFKRTIVDCLAPSEYFEHLKDFLDVL